MQLNLFDTQNLEKLHAPCVQVKPIVIRNYNGKNNEMKINTTHIIVQSCWIEKNELFGNIGIAYDEGYNRTIVFKHLNIVGNEIIFDNNDITRGRNGKKIDNNYFKFIENNLREIKKLLINLSV